jgi:hypothetical protein
MSIRNNGMNPYINIKYLIPNDSNSTHLFPLIVYLYVVLDVAASRPARSFQIALVLQLFESFHHPTTKHTQPM